MMTSLRRRQFRSPADDETFLSLIQNLHLEICSLEKETRELTERPQVDQQTAGVDGTGNPSGNDNSDPTFQNRAHISQFLAELAAYEEDQLRILTNQFLTAIVANDLPQHVRDTLNALAWKLGPEEDSESEEVKVVGAEREEAENVTIQDPEGEENRQEGLRDAEAQSGPGQDAKGGNRRNIFRFFADLWNCAWN